MSFVQTTQTEEGRTYHEYESVDTQSVPQTGTSPRARGCTGDTARARRGGHEFAQSVKRGEAYRQGTQGRAQ